TSRSKLRRNVRRRMHDDAHIIHSRVQRLLRECVRPAVYAPGVPLTVSAHTLAGEPVSRDALPPIDTFEPFTVGRKWAPAWGTTWFRFRGAVPDEWRGARVEAVIDLGFGG